LLTKKETNKQKNKERKKERKKEIERKQYPAPGTYRGRGNNKHRHNSTGHFCPAMIIGTLMTIVSEDLGRTTHGRAVPNVT